MITQRQARKALKNTNELIGPLYRDGTGWAFREWFNFKGVWVQTRRPATYREALRARKRARIVQATRDLHIISPLRIEGRAEVILSDLSRLPSPWKEAA